MNRESANIVVAQMKPREKREWTGKRSTPKHHAVDKRLLRNVAFSAAAVFCVGMTAVSLLSDEQKTAAVMTQVTADFEYDETLGRLQFVSNILPESAMVFLESSDDAISVFAPTYAQTAHEWTQEEPWIEYACMGGVKACSDGEVMTVVKNRQDEYTVRLMHEDGYESIYSGLTNVNLQENDRVIAGEQIGQAQGFAAFELRKDGLSVQPVFSAL